VLKSPLVQFLCAGLLLFVLANGFGGETEAGDAPGAGSLDRRIRVDRDALLAFVQERTGEADAAEVARRFDGFVPRVRQDWVDRFVREEALVREARSLGLDREDPLIRRRLVEKMEFLATGRTSTTVPPSDEALKAAYEARGEAYRTPPLLSFAHVFVRAPGADRQDEPSSERVRAEALLATLASEGVSFAELGAHGDRFLYQRRYVERSLDEVESHFGAAFAEAMGARAPAAESWQGPIASSHGWHLVLLTRRVESRLPTLAELTPTLARELVQERTDAARGDAIDATVAGYAIDVAPDLIRAR